MDIKEDLLIWFIIFFDKKSKESGVNTNTNANHKIKQNQSLLDLAAHQLAEELHKPIIRKLKKNNSLFKI